MLGERSVRTIAPTERLGKHFLTIMPARAPIGGTRMGWPGFQIVTSTSVSLLLFGMDAILF
ncbi:MAG: hypothetical protein OJF50_001061 [Nitrospira sp.]|nr:hypothetical protein [Nitrospira sp.]